MALDPVVLSSITAAVTLVGHEYIKGVSGEAGKTTWNSIKRLFGWHADPAVAEIPERVAMALTSSPEITEELLELLKEERTCTAAASLVKNVNIKGGSVVFAQTIHTLKM